MKIERQRKTKTRPVASPTTVGPESTPDPGRLSPLPGEAPPPDAEQFPVVGVGASAGGLAAFTEFLKHLPTDTGMAFVLVQHLDPAHESGCWSGATNHQHAGQRGQRTTRRWSPTTSYVLPRQRGSDGHHRARVAAAVRCPSPAYPAAPLTTFFSIPRAGRNETRHSA